MSPSLGVIERVVEHTADTRSLFLRVPERTFRFIPGQFISLQLVIDGQSLVRPYSIASDPEQSDVLEICLNIVPGGLASVYLFSLRVGVELPFTGPWGTFTLADPPTLETVFIADGTGIAPIRPMLRRALATELAAPVRVHYRAQSEAELLYRAEWQALAQQHRWFSFEPIITPSCAVLLERMQARYVAADQDRGRSFYICGVGDVVTRLRDTLRGAGYARRAVRYEKW
jgi:CDP-4-dehydro-6-deoxyglucose reductase